VVEKGVRLLSAFFYTVAGIVFGGVVSAVISYYFARKASEELREEADKLREETKDVSHYINALISYLEAAGAISVVRDEAGRPIETRIIRLSGAVLGVSGLSATVTVEEADAPEGHAPDDEEAP
jgi:hypothetical protein